MFGLAFFLGVALMAALARLDPPGNSTPDEILQLHECIKLRFLDTRSFGMRRILPQQFHGIHDFRAENPVEQHVLDKLRQRGYDVALYMAGLKILEASPVLNGRRYSVQGPAFMTPWRQDEFPEPKTLLDDSRRALIDFETAAGYEIQKPGWKVAMRPMLATTERCVGCHKSGDTNSALKIGNPIGVAMYVYRMRSATPSK